MAADDVDIRVRLLDAARARADALRVASGIKQIGTHANYTAFAAGKMGTAIDRAGHLAGRGLANVAQYTRYAAAGVAGLGVATVKWGLSFNAQVESSRLRFKLFTNDVDGLTKAVQHIDLNSAFNFGDLSDAAALLGNSNVKDIPGVLQASANAAAASGKGLPALQGITVALAQMAAKGRLSQEEINQLNEAGAPGAQLAIQKAFGLTAKQVGNLGGQGLSSTKAIRVLTKEWTSGRMAKAASDQTKTLGGQWALLTGNVQKATGAMTLGLAGGLEHDVLPAANRAAQAITAIFGKDGLSDKEKMRQARAVIEKELGPVWDDLKQDLDDAHIPEHLGVLVGKGTVAMEAAAVDAAPHVASAFVHAWLHSGPWTQLASTLFLARKFQKFFGGGSGGGLGRGGIGGLFSRTKPIPVYVVNGMGGVPGGGGTPGRSTGGRIVSGAKRVAPFAGRVGLGVGAVAGTEAVKDHFAPNIDSAIPNPAANLGEIGHVLAGLNPFHRGSGASLSGVIQPKIALESRLDVRTFLDGKEVSRNQRRVNARDAARRSGGRGPQGLPG